MQKTTTTVGSRYCEHTTALSTRTDSLSHTNQKYQVIRAASTSTIPINTAGPTLISMDKVCEMLGVQRTFVNERVASGDLPKPIKFGTSKRAAIRFVLSEIQDYIARLAAERHLSGAPDKTSTK